MILNKSKIKKLLNIESGFLYIDTGRILKNKNISISETKINPSDKIFKEHLKDDPVYPGVLLIEMMCQTTMLDIYNKNLRNYSSRGFLTSVNIHFKNTLRQKNCPTTLRSKSVRVFFKRGISVYKVKILNKKTNATLAQGEVSHFISPFLKK